MRESAFIRGVGEELRKLGYPRKRMFEHLRELTEHREDLRLEEMAHGVSEIEAEARAEARLGDSRQVAEDLMAVCRRSHWWGKFPFLIFCLLPPVAGLVLFALLVMFSGFLIRSFGHNFLPGSWADGGSTLEWLDHGVRLLYCASALGATIVFSKLARNSGCGWKWMFVVCAVCAAVGYVGCPMLRPHCFLFRFYVGLNDGFSWLGGILPVSFAAISYSRGMQRDFSAIPLRFGGVVMAGILAFSTIGCASQSKAKPEYQRGWIGGTYKVMPRFKPAGETNATPTGSVSKTVQKNGLLVLALGTNSPARSAGLEEGDLILEVDHTPVTTLKAFYRNVDKATPGETLTVSALRDGAVREFCVPVGRETYQEAHYLGFGLFARQFKIGADPTISLLVLGYEKWPPSREDMASVENRYLLSADPKADLEDPGWSAWAGIIGIGGSQKLVKQESVTPASPDSSLR